MLDYFVSPSRFRKLTLFTAIMTYLLVVLGGIVRVTGSGLGCLDWPFCTQPFPDDHIKPALEMGHRFVAAFVTILIVLVAVAAWRGYRQNKWIFRSALVGLGVIFFQIILGAITVLLKNQPITVVAHFGAALSMLACATIIATAARLPEGVSAARTPLRKWAWRSVVFVGGLLFFGALVTGTNSALGCLTDWPLCRGQLIPNSTDLETYVNWFHRFFALLTGLVLAYTTVVAWRSKDKQHSAWIVAALMLSFFVIQAVIGGAVVLSHIQLVWRGFHLAMAAATWTAAIVLLVLAVRSGQPQWADSRQPDRASSSRSAGNAPAVSDSLETHEAPLTRKQLIGAYVKLSKPWVVVLLLVTTFAAMLIAQKGLPPLPLVFFTLLGGALSAGGASAINSYIDRDIDGFMSRTRNRPVVTHRIAPDNALAYGIAAGVASFVILTLAANLLAAVLAMIGLLYYVFIYTGYLKRSTPHNIVIGGVAGAIPPLVGYAAVTGTVDVLALFLFLVIFYWTPPHTWALGLLIRTDYERVNIPMLPVVAGETETRKQILLYTLQMIAVTLLLFAFHMMGWIYFVAALLLNALFLARALKLWRLPDTNKALAKRLYKFSQSYLALLFLAMVLDKIILV